MMLYPSMNSMLKRVNSRYMLVNVVAKRSRDIADEAIANEEKLEKKPVSMAIEELTGDEFRVVAHPQKAD